MRKQFRLLIILTAFLSLMMVLPASGQAPPPPAHGQNGNQTSTGGTGCPIDRTQGIVLAMALCLGYAGFVLFQRGRKKEEV